MKHCITSNVDWQFAFEMMPVEGIGYHPGLTLVFLFLQVCGAAHSGWRGTLDMIDAAVIDVMLTRFECKVKNIVVAIGPSIAPCCFEVGDDVAEKFTTAFGDSVVVWTEGQPRPFVDLRLSIRLQLEKKGVPPKNIDDGTR